MVFHWRLSDSIIIIIIIINIFIIIIIIIIIWIFSSIFENILLSRYTAIIKLQ